MLIPFAMAAMFFRTGMRVFSIPKEIVTRRSLARVGNGVKQRLFGRSGSFRRRSGAGMLRHRIRAFEPSGIPEVEQHLRPGGEPVRGELERGGRSPSVEAP